MAQKITLIAFFILSSGSLPLLAESFLFFGDAGTGTSIQKDIAKSMAQTCKQLGCDFAVVLGDNIYPKGVKDVSDPQFQDKFESIYCSMGIPFHMSLGNHDYDGNAKAQIEYSARSKCWQMPSEFYTFQGTFADFFAVDTEKLSAEQVLWLRRHLSESSKDWKIVFGHRPIWSYGEHGHSYELWPWLWPLLKTYKATAYLSGHDHVRQVIQGNGIQYLVSGAAGDPKDSVKNQNGQAVFAKGGGGYGHMEISAKSLTVRMFDAQGQMDYLNTTEK